MPTIPTQICIDELTRKQASELLAGLGMNLSEAVNIFLKQVVLRGGLPFEITYPEYKPEVIEALEDAKKKSVMIQILHVLVVLQKL